MRYRATCSVVWDFNSQMSQNEALEFAKKHLGEIPKNDEIDDCRLILRLDKLKDKVQKICLGEFQIDEVMQHVSEFDETKREFESNGVKHLVKMNSDRLLLFKSCMKCVSCDLEGTRIFLECHPADKSPHFNLYGEENGNLILFTKDHIHARAFGGEDSIENYQTMCLLCNNLKGHSNLSLEGVRALRTVYNENKNVVSKKQLHILIEDARHKLEQPWNLEKKSGTQRRKYKAKSKASCDVVVVAYDLFLYKFKGKFEIFGKSIHDQVDEKFTKIGELKKGTKLEPLLATKEQVMCQLDENDVVVLHHSLINDK